MNPQTGIERIIESFKVRKRDEFLMPQFKNRLLFFVVANLFASLVAVWSLGTPPITQIVYPIASIPFSVFAAYMETRYMWGIETRGGIASWYYMLPTIALQIFLFINVLPRLYV